MSEEGLSIARRSLDIGLGLAQRDGCYLGMLTLYSTLNYSFKIMLEIINTIKDVFNIPLSAAVVVVAVAVVAAVEQIAALLGPLNALVMAHAFQ